MPSLPPIKQFQADNGIRVYRIPCDVLPRLSGRVYLLMDSDIPTLIDTGSGAEHCTAQIFEGLAKVRSEFGEAFDLRTLGRVVLTHAHIDHFGGLAEVVRRTGAEVAVHGLDRRAVEAYDHRAIKSNFAFDRFLKQAGVVADRRRAMLEEFGYYKGRLASVPVDLELEDGLSLGGVCVVHTPGHSPGHVCLAVGDILIAGDHVLARTVSQLWPESVAAYTGLGHYLDSLERIRRAGPFSLVLSGHEPVIHDLPGRLDEIASAHQRRLDRILEILSDTSTALTIEQLSERMYSRQKGYPALLALTDVGARVEYLEERGRIAITNIDDLENDEHPIFRYSAV